MTQDLRGDYLKPNIQFSPGYFITDRLLCPRGSSALRSESSFHHCSILISDCILRCATALITRHHIHNLGHGFHL